MPTLPEDWIAVHTVRTRLATSIDLRDWVGVRTTLAPTLELDYSSHDPARTPGPVAADDWVAYLATLFPGLDATSHLLGMPVIDVDGDRATSRTQVIAEHVLDDDRFTLGGHYDDRYRRSGDGWVVEAVGLTVRWTDGDRSVLARGLTRGAALAGAAARPTPPGAPR